MPRFSFVTDGVDKIIKIMHGGKPCRPCIKIMKTAKFNKIFSLAALEFCGDIFYQRIFFFGLRQCSVLTHKE